MGLSRELFEAQLVEIDHVRHEIRTAMVDREIHFLDANRLLNACDEKERKLRARWGAQLGDFFEGKRLERAAGQREFNLAHSTHTNKKLADRRDKRQHDGAEEFNVTRRRT
jgi:hypothetical protein